MSHNNLVETKESVCVKNQRRAGQAFFGSILRKRGILSCNPLGGAIICICFDMEELIKLLTQVELAADNIIDTKQQIVDFDARRHKTREALSQLRDLRTKEQGNKKYWVCVGDMFIRLNDNETKNWISEDHYQLNEAIEKLRDDLKEKVIDLRKLEGKPEVSGLNLKPLNRKEIEAFRTAFKI